MKPKNILLIKPSSLGDIIHTLPLLYAIKKGFPNSSISWLVKKEWEPIVKLSPYVDNVIGTSFSLKNIPEIIKQAKGNGKKFDLAIDAQCLIRSALIGSFSKTRIGFASGREYSPLFYDIKVVTDKIHAVDRYIDLAKALNCDTETRDFSLTVPENIQKSVNDMLEKDQLKESLKKGRLIAINPNARWDTKRWPIEHFRQLIDLLIKNNFSIIILGSKSEMEYTKFLDQPFDKKNQVKTVNYTGKLNLVGLVAMLKSVNLLITNDTGPMHIAAAVDTPVLALFGATDPDKTGPYNKKSKVLYSKQKCSPCLKRKCRYNLECLKEIQPIKVLDELKQMIN